MKSTLVALAAATVLAPLASTLFADARYRVVIDPSNSYGFAVMEGDKSLLRIGMAGWGPKWGWTSIGSQQKAVDGVLSFTSPVVINQAQQQVIQLGLTAKKAGANTVELKYDLSADKDVPLTMLTATVGIAEGGSGRVVLTSPAGANTTWNLPIGVSAAGDVSKTVFTGNGWGGPIEATFSPAIKTAADGAVRFMLASDLMKAGKTSNTVTLTFPGEVDFMASQADIDKLAPVLPQADWYPYQPKYEYTATSPMGMESWLEAPAGKHGGVRMVGDHFEFTDGTPAKFFGVNLSYALNAPQKQDADLTVARFARHGVNAVRMHKFTYANGWEGIGDPNDTTKMTPEGLDRLDYFSNQLRQKGIYYGWSHSFALRIRPGDKSRLAGFDELMKKGGNTYAVINFAEDVQDLMIEMVVNLLNHKNPHSGTTYAQDPALCFVELQNEDDIFFYTNETAYNDFPTYRTILLKQYAQWLTEKYGSQEKLAAAWQGALKSEESLAAANVAIQPNPWSMGDDNLPRARGGDRQRLLDNAAFLHETQNRFYTKFVKAIRATGYQGPIVGSPWQAPAMLPHYYNLRSDHLAGYIDRHNYFGEALNDTMLKSPGSGYFSSGLQQVADRPFGLSEWISQYPCLNSAEGPVIIAAYGMGLQGWDASYEFQSTSNRPAGNVGNQPHGIWNADLPTQVGQYPILNRMLMRGDVKEAPIISTRRISPENLAKGEFNFSDKVKQQGDVKSFGGQVTPEALAAGRVVVEFVEKDQPSTFPDMAKYKQGNTIISATGQLRWDAGQGTITIDTPGTQGICGFVGGRGERGGRGQQYKLSNLTIRPETPYASILLTAAGREETLQNAKRILVSAVARNANSGMRMLTIDNRTIVDNGKAPVLLEPVKAEIELPGKQIERVQILDHDGKTTGRSVPVQNGVFTIDGARDKAFYYVIDLQ